MRDLKENYIDLNIRERPLTALPQPEIELFTKEEIETMKRNAIKLYEQYQGELQNMTTNKQPTTLVIKDRATGKTTQLLYTSATTQYPILVQNKLQTTLLLEKADDLDLIIPVPMTVDEFKQKREMNYDCVLVDEGYNLIGEALDNYIGTHVAAVTLTDRVKETADKRVVRA